MLKVINILSLVVFVISLGLGTPVGAQEINYKGLVLSEVKVRYDSTSGLDVDEFIELHNDSLSPVLLSDYSIEYFNSTIISSAQQPVQAAIDTRVLEPGAQLVLAKQPTQIEHSIQSPLSSLQDSGGRLRLVTVEGEVIDELSWTNNQSLAQPLAAPPVMYQCNTSGVLCVANRVQSYSRSVDAEGDYLAIAPFWQLSVISPQSSELIVLEEEPPIETDPVQEEESPPQQTQTCEGIVISEILPNPKGADTGHEFVELHNPTADFISLAGCALQVSSASKKYNFGAVELGPGAYTAFHDNITSLTLPNSAGGTVWLLSPTEELQSVIYPPALDDDVAWVNIEGVWALTYSPTPNVSNLLISQEPCSEGEIRDVSSGECQKPVVTAVSSLATCRPGQERNPETNRCRTIAPAVSVLVACKQGQERNPETNRCRNVLGTSSLETCDEGEERNPETNRCRKTLGTAGSSLASVTDVPSPVSSFGPSWWIAGGVALIAIGYAIFEWRQEIGLLLSRATSKFRP